MKLSFIKGALVPADDEAKALGLKYRVGDVIEFAILNPRRATFNNKVFVSLDEIAKMLGIEPDALRGEILIETGRAKNLKLRDGTRAWLLPSMSKASMTMTELEAFWEDARVYIAKEVMISLDGDQQERVRAMIGIDEHGVINPLMAG